MGTRAAMNCSSDVNFVEEGLAEVIERSPSVYPYHWFCSSLDVFLGSHEGCITLKIRSGLIIADHIILNLRKTGMEAIHCTADVTFK